MGMQLEHCTVQFESYITLCGRCDSASINLNLVITVSLNPTRRSTKIMDNFSMRHSGVVVSTVASQQEGPGFDSQACAEFTCSLCVCVGSVQVLQLPPTVQKPAN